MNRRRRSAPARLLRSLVGVVVGALLLTGCDFNVYELPLPGGTDVGDDPITVHVMFDDVLDLVPQSSVKVNDVSVGQVTDIELAGTHADVTVELPNDTELPADATASIRQTSLLGEKFVSLEPPTGGGSGQLADGDTIPLERTGRNPEVEEVLGALSLILNGGGVAQLKTITEELNKTLEGREGSARSVLTQVRSLVTQLDAGKDDIVTAIDSLNDLSVSARKQEDNIDAALEELPSALTSLDKQRGDLVKMLKALDRLGDVGVRVIKASKDATIDTVKQLAPTLTELANSGQDFVNAFNVFLTYPFVDEVVGRDPQVARNLHMGDYTNLSIELDLSLAGENDTGPATLPTNLPGPVDPTKIVGNVLKCLQSGDLLGKACKKVLKTPFKLLKLKKICRKKKNEDKDLCKQLNLLPDLPDGLPLPSALGDLLPDLPLLGRTGFGPRKQGFGPRGPTMGQLTRLFDPALVHLLVPGMVR